MINIKTMKVYYENCYNGYKGFSFSLFPVITFDKEKYVKYNKYALMFGVWFWYVEFEWTVNQ